MKRIGTLGCPLALGIPALAISCGGDPANDSGNPIKSRQQPVTTSIQFNATLGCAITPSEYQAFNARLQQAHKVGRRAAHSRGMKDCLSKVLTTGPWLFPHSCVGKNWGPYCAPDTPGCDSGVVNYGDPGDPYRPANGTGVLEGATDSEFGRALAHRAFVHGRSANPAIVRCSEHGTGGFIDPGDVIDPAVVTELEIVEFRSDSVANWANDALPANTYGPIAGLLWHEVLHTHGFEHDNDAGVDCNNPPNATKRHLDQVPHIYGACLEQLVRDAANTNICPTSCPSGKYPVLDAYVRNPNGNLIQGASSYCSCQPDPSVPHSRTETDYGLPGSMVADSTGNEYLLYYGGLFQRNSDDTGWEYLSASGVNKIHAGGDRVFYEKNGDLYRQDSATGTEFTNLGPFSPEGIDDFATAYIVYYGNPYEYRLHGPGWEAMLGNGFEELHVAGDRVFGTKENGDIYRWKRSAHTWELAGGPGADFEVTAIGTLYGLATDKSAVYRNDGGASWDWVGGASDEIEAGVRLFGANGNGAVYELYHNGVWNYASGNVDLSEGFTARADVLLTADNDGHWRRSLP